MTESSYYERNVYNVTWVVIALWTLFCVLLIVGLLNKKLLSLTVSITSIVILYVIVVRWLMERGWYEEFYYLKSFQEKLATYKISVVKIISLLTLLAIVVMTTPLSEAVLTTIGICLISIFLWLIYTGRISL